MMSASLDVSFVVPARNEADCIAACVASLMRQAGSFRSEVIVVDNGSTDDTAALASSVGARVVTEPRPGLAHARQAGLYAAQAPILVYVDADTMLPPGWTADALRLFRRDPGLAAISPAFRFHDGRRRDDLGNLIFRRVLAPMTDGALRAVGRSGILIGSTMAVRTAALRAAGGVDLAFQFYGEDTMIARRLNLHGDVRFVQEPTLHTSARRYQDRGLLHVVYRYFVIFVLIQLGRLALAARLARTFSACDRKQTDSGRCRAMLLTSLRGEPFVPEQPLAADETSAEPWLQLDA